MFKAPRDVIEPPPMFVVTVHFRSITIFKDDEDPLRIVDRFRETLADTQPPVPTAVEGSSRGAEGLTKLNQFIILV